MDDRTRSSISKSSLIIHEYIYILVPNQNYYRKSKIMKNHVSRFHRSPINTAIILNIQSDPYPLCNNLGKRTTSTTFFLVVSQSLSVVLTYHLCKWACQHRIQCSIITTTACLSPFTLSLFVPNIRSNTYVKHEILIYSIKLIFCPNKSVVVTFEKF